MSPKIGLCLESFAVGDRAKRLYDGATAMDWMAAARWRSPADAPPPI